MGWGKDYERVLMLATSPSSDLPAFMVVADTNGPAFRCDIDGISRENLAVAIDALNKARGKFKKLVKSADPAVDSELPTPLDTLGGAMAQVMCVKSPDATDTTEPPTPTKKNNERVLLQEKLDNTNPNEIVKIQTLMTDIWVSFAERAKEGKFFVFNHELTPLITKHFGLRGIQITHFYSVRLLPFGKSVEGDTCKADGWEFDLELVEAFCNRQTGMPGRHVKRPVIYLPPLSGDGNTVTAQYPELREPGQPATPDADETTIVLTGEQLAAKLGSSTLLDVELIAQAIRLLAEHEAHKANAEAIENSIRDMESSRDAVEAEREALLLRVAEMDKQLLGAKNSIDNASVRLSTARHMIVRTRLPQETLEKLALMRQQLERMRQQLDVLFAASGGGK